MQDNSYNISKSIIHAIFQKAVVKSCENDLSNTILVVKVKVEFHIMIEKSYNKTIMVDIRIYLPSKVIFTSALRPR